MVDASFDPEMIKYAIDDHFENKRQKMEQENQVVGDQKQSRTE